MEVLEPENRCFGREFRHEDVTYEIKPGVVLPYPRIRHWYDRDNLVIYGLDYPLTSRAYLPRELGEFIWGFEEAVNLPDRTRLQSRRVNHSIVFSTGAIKAVEICQKQELNNLNKPYEWVSDLENLPLVMRFDWKERLNRGYTPEIHRPRTAQILRMLTTGGADFDSKHDPQYWNRNPLDQFRRAMEYLKAHYAESHQGTKTQYFRSRLFLIRIIQLFMKRRQ